MAKGNWMPVRVGQKIYPSHGHAAEALGISKTAISQRLRRRGHAETIPEGGVPGNMNAAKPITIYGTTFPSRKAAAEALGITRSQLSKWLSDKASPAQRQMMLSAMMRYQLNSDR